MAMEALRGYLQLASGLTEVTRDRARGAARALVAQAGQLGDPDDARAQVRALADDLATTARANRDLLLGVVRAETERVIASLGLATADDLAALHRRLDAVERRSRATAPDAQGDERRPRAESQPEGSGSKGSEPAPAKSTPAKQPPAKHTAKKSPAQKSPAKKSAGTKSPAKKAAGTTASTSRGGDSTPDDPTRPATAPQSQGTGDDD